MFGDFEFKGDRDKTFDDLGRICHETCPGQV